MAKHAFSGQKNQQTPYVKQEPLQNLDNNT